MPADFVHTRRIPALPPDVPGAGRLGRHVRHDPRSRAFAYKPATVSLRSRSHPRRIPVLDQGELGKCTAEASVGALGTDPFFPSLSDLGQLTFDDVMSNDLYSQFTREDSYDGTWPPDDTGSDGLTAAKVLKERGLISGYQHAFTLEDALAALSGNGDDDPGRPVITGVNWYSSMDKPTSYGQVSITSQAYVRGGHEFEVSSIDVAQKRVWCWQSWGASWGVNGMFWMSWDTWERLLHEEGDVTVFVPRGGVTPAPTVDPADLALAAAFRTGNWVGSHHVGANKAAALAAAAWLKARNL
jgi:hypothetical protein